MQNEYFLTCVFEVKKKTYWKDGPSPRRGKGERRGRKVREEGRDIIRLYARW